MKLTEEQANNVYENNMKAKAILKSVMVYLVNGEDDFDEVSMLDAVLDYVSSNDKLFASVM